MGAKDFFDKQKAALATTVKELEKEGKELSKQVNSSISNNVEVGLNDIVSDFKKDIGAVSSALGSLSGGLSGLISSVKNQAQSAVSSAIKGVDINALAGGLLGGGIKINLPTFNIGNLSIGVNALAGLVSKAVGELKSVVTKAKSVELKDNLNVNPTLSGKTLKNPVAQGVPEAMTDDYDEVIVESQEEAERLSNQGAIPPNTVVKTRKEKKYFYVSDTDPNDPRAGNADSGFRTSKVETLFEHNKKKKAAGEKPVFPKGGQKVGPKIDGVPVVDPKPEPVDMTPSSSKIYKAKERLANSGAAQANKQFDIEQQIAQISSRIQQLTEEMDTKVREEQVRLINTTGVGDGPTVEQIYREYEPRIGLLKKEREELRAKLKAEGGGGPDAVDQALAADDPEFDAAVSGEDSAFDAALEGGESTGNAEVTTSGGGETVTTAPPKSEEQRAREDEETRANKERERIDAGYKSRAAAEKGIRKAQGVYPNRKYEIYTITEATNGSERRALKRSGDGLIYKIRRRN